MARGRRIYFDGTNGAIILDTGEVHEEAPAFSEFSNIQYIDLDYGANAAEFGRVIRYHVDPETKTVVFDELAPIQQDKDAYITELENELLMARGLI